MGCAYLLKLEQVAFGMELPALENESTAYALDPKVTFIGHC